MNAKRALVISESPPTFDRDSGSKRLFNFVELLLADGWAVSFLSKHAPNEIRYQRALQQMGVAVYDGTEAPVDRLLERCQFHVALIAFWPVAETYLPLIRCHSPHTRIIVDSVDLHFVRAARRVFGSLTTQRSGGLLDSNFSTELARELNVYASADGVLTVSQKEANLIGDLIPEPGLAHLVPDMETFSQSPLSAAKRRGMVFVGSFRHEPNIDAVEFLCKSVVPRLDPGLIERHPLSVVGDHLDEKVRALGEDLPHVQMVGWVPSVQPYLANARLSVIPLRYGAGTKRKLLQSLMVGTPAVSTTVGVEGFGLRDGADVLVADDPLCFASAIARLLTDDSLWRRLSRQGRARLMATHSREAVQLLFREMLSQVLQAAPKPPFLEQTPTSTETNQYGQLRRGIRQLVESQLPLAATVIVVSRGDEELLNLNGRTAWHFPQTLDGRYAGHHPADSHEAIAQLKTLQSRGGEYLLLPSTMFWWLEYYPGFAEHLATQAREVFRRPDLGALYKFAPNGREDPSRVASNPARLIATATATVFSEAHQPCCALLTVADWDTLRQWRECVESHAAYSRKFGYKWLLASAPLSARPAMSWDDWSWAKIFALNRAMERLPDGAYLMCVDADVCIAQNAPDWSVQEWWHKGGSVPFVFMAKGHSKRFNAGVQMYRNCAEARSFITTLLKLRADPDFSSIEIPPPPKELLSFFLAENGPIIHLTNCRPEWVQEIPPRWNNTIDPKAADYLRHFTGPMKDHYRTVAAERPRALIILNTPWHFECVAPWIYYLAQLGFNVHIDVLNIGDRPDRLASLAGLRYGGPFIEQVRLFESYTTSDGQWAQRFLRLRKDAVPPTGGYSLLIVLSHYAYWSQPFSNRDAAVVSASLAGQIGKPLPVVLLCHTSVAAAGQSNRLPEMAGIDSSGRGPLAYLVCCTTKHGLHSLRQAVGPNRLRAGHFIGLYANIWTSSLDEDLRRWKERQRVRLVLQGRLSPDHRAFRKLVQAVNLLRADTRQAIVISIIGSGKESDLRHMLRELGLPDDSPCVDILAGLDERAFDEALKQSHIVFDCLDEAIIDREHYLVDRLTSTITRGLPLSKPLLCHAAIARIYSIQPNACECYTDDPRTLARAITQIVAYTDAEYGKRCRAMRSLFLKVHEENIDALSSLLAGWVENLPQVSSGLHPLADALTVTDSESFEPSVDTAAEREERPSVLSSDHRNETGPRGRVQPDGPLTISTWGNERRPANGRYAFTEKIAK